MSDPTKPLCWIIYDGRAASGDSSGANVYCTCDSMREVRQMLTVFPDGVVYVVEMVDGERKERPL